MHNIFLYWKSFYGGDFPSNENPLQAFQEAQSRYVHKVPLNILSAIMNIWGSQKGNKSKYLAIRQPIPIFQDTRSHPSQGLLSGGVNRNIPCFPLNEFSNQIVSAPANSLWETKSKLQVKSVFETVSDNTWKKFSTTDAASLKTNFGDSIQVKAVIIISAKTRAWLS